MRVAYICDCKMSCSKSSGCCINKGPCRHTFDINHAKNFEETPIVIGNDKFVNVTPGDGTGEAAYIEVGK